MPRNALWAATHPCYVFPGYTCNCGIHSKDIKEHNKHVREKHSDDKEFCEKVLSWHEFDKMFPGEMACSDCRKPNSVPKPLRAGRCVTCYPAYRERKKQPHSLIERIAGK